MERVALRYALFQLPELGLAIALAVAAWNFYEVPPRLAALAVGLWVLKDVALYPFVRSAYERPAAGPEAQLVGVLVRVERTLQPSGTVRLGAELWRAECPRDQAPVPVGASVRVLGIEGLLLRVERADSEPPV